MVTARTIARVKTIPAIASPFGIPATARTSTIIASYAPAPPGVTIANAARLASP